MDAIFIGFLFIVVATLYYLYKKDKGSQLEFIHRYKYHPALYKKVHSRYPHLSEDEIQKVFSALSDYFYICNKANSKMVAMPSQVVDVAWHEFILFTRSYQAFCTKAVGRFLHHSPTESIQGDASAKESIKRAWNLACEKESINPKSPNNLPLLFSIDSLLNIEDGFKYSLNCKDKSSPNYSSGYCASDLGCSGSTSSFMSSGGDGAGCGGSSCGGGCGGS